MLYSNGLYVIRYLTDSLPFLLALKLANMTNVKLIINARLIYSFFWHIGFPVPFDVEAGNKLISQMPEKQHVSVVQKRGRT